MVISFLEGSKLIESGVGPRVYKELNKLTTKIPNNPIKKWGIELNQKFTTEES